MKLPEVGSKWWSGNIKSFYVKSVIELEGNTWVHYGEYGTDKEYSCYLESFLHRFSETPA
jgi:hypothetical protein